jgi:hypothetical protein
MNVMTYYLFVVLPRYSKYILKQNINLKCANIPSENHVVKGMLDKMLIVENFACAKTIAQRNHNHIVNITALH